MAIGLSSYAYRWTLADRGGVFPAIRLFLELAIEHGVEAVQICDNLRFWEMTDSELDDVAGLARAAGVSVETGARGTDPALIRRAIGASRRLESRLLRTVVEIDRSRPVAHQLERAASDLRSLLPDLRAGGVAVALENHATTTASELLAVMEAVGDPLAGACIDTMNSILLLERPLETVRALAPHALTVHLKDFRTIKAPGQYVIDGTAVGDGMVDFPAVIDLIRAGGRNPSFHVELYVGREGPDPLDHEKALVERSILFARRQLGL